MDLLELVAQAAGLDGSGTRTEGPR
jgi:hypothetical protein